MTFLQFLKEFSVPVFSGFRRCKTAQEASKIAPKKSSGIRDGQCPGTAAPTFRPGIPRGRPARAN